MITTINRTRLVDSIKFLSNKPKASGVIDGKRWSIIEKRLVAPEMYRYVFKVEENYSTGEKTIYSRTVITGDEDIRYVAEVALMPLPPDEGYKPWER